MMHAYDGRKQLPETHTQALRIYCLDSVCVHGYDGRPASSSILVALLLH
jgi:hypothetical protein